MFHYIEMTKMDTAMRYSLPEETKIDQGCIIFSQERTKIDTALLYTLPEEDKDGYSVALSFSWRGQRWLQRSMFHYIEMTKMDTTMRYSLPEETKIDQRCIILSQERTKIDAGIALHST